MCSRLSKQRFRCSTECSSCDMTQQALLAMEQFFGKVKATSRRWTSNCFTLTIGWLQLILVSGWVLRLYCLVNQNDKHLTIKLLQPFMSEDFPKSFRAFCTWVKICPYVICS
ncbi:hypothetical protein PVAP13_1NG440200 [Panicum virgatum]|uniref:Uncharacterized protein n=1 Tax=Panicum virgatum TaxID=38727 RepID=A0A8T0X350_PANVG|nr:hypothetical protein PVAP13_1NG440200 [Panicum virgatum]